MKAEGIVLTRGLIFGLLAAFLWGTHSVLVQFLTGDLGAVEIATLRLYIAAATLLIVLLLLRQPISIPIRNRYFLLAVAATFVNYILFHLGLERTNAPSAMVLENTAPFFVLVFLFVFWRVPVKGAEIAATFLAIFGVALTVLRDLEGGGVRLTGDILELFAGMTWAVFLIASSKAMQQSHSTGERLNFLFGIFCLTALLLTPVALPNATLPTLGNLVPLAFLGILATGLAYYFWYEAAVKLSTLTATLMFALSVVFTFVNAHLFLNEPIGLLQIVGAILIVIGILMASLAKSD